MQSDITVYGKTLHYSVAIFSQYTIVCHMGIICCFTPTQQAVDGFGMMAADVVVDIVLCVGIGIVDKGEYLVLACVIERPVETHVVHYTLFGTNSYL